MADAIDDFPKHLVEFCRGPYDGARFQVVPACYIQCRMAEENATISAGPIVHTKRLFSYMQTERTTEDGAIIYQFVG